MFNVVRFVYGGDNNSTLWPRQILLMPSESFLPPGHHPLDQASGEKNPVDYHLERLHTYLHWNREHFASFKHDRDLNPENAERELGHLDDSIDRGYGHLRRLSDLLRAGYQPTLDNQ